MIRALQQDIEGRGRSTVASIAWMTVTRVLAFLLAFQGLPVSFIPDDAPAPLRLIKEAIETPPVYAYQVKRVLKGAVTMAAGTEVLAYNLEDPNNDANTADSLLGGQLMDPNKAMVLITNSANSVVRTDTSISALIDDVRTLLLTRRASAVQSIVEYFIIEFVSGVTVLSGTTTIAESGSTCQIKNITLPQSFDTAKSIPTVQVRAYTAANTDDERNLFKAQLTSATNLRLQRVECANGYNADLTYQVIGFDLSEADAAKADVKVQSGEFVFNNTDDGPEATDAAGASTMTITSVDPARSVLFMNYMTSGNTAGREFRYAVDGTITNATTLTFRRQDTTTTYSQTVDWHVLEFRDNTYVQKNRTSVTSVNNTATNVTLSSSPATRLPRSFVNLTSSISNTTGGSSALDEISVRGQLSTATNLALTREATAGDSANTSWFVAQMPPLRLLQPNGDEVLEVSDPADSATYYTIKWDWADDVASDAVTLEYSPNNGTNYYAITCENFGSPIASNGTTGCQWKIPQEVGTNVNVISSTGLIRITDTNGTNAPSPYNTDVSNKVFRIKGRLAMVEPDGADLWKVGETGKLIRWKHFGLMDPGATTNCELFYSTAGAAGPWTSINNSVSCGTAAAGTINTSTLWDPVPNIVGTQMRIKIEDNDATADVYDFSAADFEVRPDIEIKAPLNTDQLLRGRDFTVKWCTTGSVGNVDILLSTNNGADYALIPDGPDGGSVPDGQNVVGTSAGTNTALCPGTLKTEYSWVWSVGSTTALTTGAKLKIQKNGDANIVDTGPDAGDAAFDLISSVSLDGPATSTILRALQSADITWSQGGGSGLGNVRLKYCTSYTTNGTDGTTCQANPADADWVQITTPDASNLSAAATPFSWTVPNIIGTNVGLLAQEIANPTLVYDVRGPYTVKGKVTVTAPASAETLRVGGNKVIEWDDFGTIGTVYICLQKESSGACDYNILDAGTVPAGVDAADGTYNWTNIPDQRCTVCNIKVYKAGDSDLTTGVADLSDTFTIKGNISNVQVNQGTYQIGDTAAITWDEAPAGWTANVKLQYSKDGTTWNDVMCELGAPGPAGDSAVVPANTSCDWVVPDADLLTNTDRIRVSVVGDEASTNATSAFFTVNGNLELTYPSENSGDLAQTWLVGEQKTITWNFQGASIGTVKLYYSKDNGTDLYNTVIFDETATINATQGSYLWTLPSNVIGAAEQNAQIKLKLVSHSNANIASISAQPVTIRARLTNLAPDGGTTWAVGDTDKSVTWQTQGSVPLINCKYSTDGGTSYGGTIATGVSNANGCAWNPIDGPVDNDIKYRVESSANPGVIFLVSTNVNTIKGKVAVTSPDATNVGASSLKVGDNHTITWTPSGNVGNVSIYYAADGATWGSAIFTGVDGNTGNKGPWTVPDTLDLAADEKIKIECETAWKCDPAQSAAFNIKGTLSLVEPNNGEVYSVGGSPIAITWTSTGSLGDLNLYYDTTAGGGGYPNQINGAPVPYNANTGGCSVTPPQYCYTWTVPASTGNQYRVKAVAIGDSAVVDTSLGNFVVRGSVALVKPGKNPGAVESWAVDGSLTYGFTSTIDWTYNGVQFVDLHLDTNGGNDGYPIAIATNLASTSAPYTWTIPGGQYVQVTSDLARVRIRDANDPLFVTSASTNNFKIKPILSLTAPLAAAKWYIGTQYLITWDAPLGKADNLKIEYSLDGGSSWVGTAIAASVPSTNLQYPWTPPSQASNTDTVIRISKVGDAESTDASPQFNILSDFTLNAPTNNPAMGIATTVPITWTPVGLPGASQIMYSTVASPGPGDWLAVTGAENIADPVGTTSFNWTVPDAPSPNVWVKIFDKTYPDDVIGTSPQANAIIGSITPVSSPAANAEMIVGQPFTITWTKNGAITKFKIEYHDGTGWFPITPTFTTNYPNYTWTSVDDRISSTVKVRVSDNDNPSVYGETAATVKIKGSIDLTAPNGAETLVMGQPFTIKWAKTGTLGNVKLEYSTDNFASDIRTITASVGSDVCQDGGQTCPNYVWTPTTAQINYADMNADVLKVRVTSIGGIPVTDQSANAFKVVGTITNVQPSGSAVIWSKGDTTKSVTWNQAGSITTVNIRYKTASADTFNKTIVLGHTGHAEGSNNYAVPAVPDENSEDVWVEVADAGNAAVKGQSAAAFSIRPVITVSAPAAGQNVVVGSSNPNAVQWSLNGSAKVSTVNVVYQTDGGAFDKTIASNVAATDGQVSWNSVTNTLSGSQAKNLAVVKVVDTANANVFGLSPTFDIVGKIVIDSPTGADNWQAGSAQSISWTPSGNLGNVKLYYYHDGAYEAIPGGTVAYNSSPFSWNPVPAQVENNTTIKIVDLDTEGTGDEVAGVSAAYDLIGGFAFNPQPPATLSAGASYTVTWDRIAASEIPNAKLEFFDSTNGWRNIDYATTDTGVVSNSGSYGWTIPANVTCTACKFRLSDPNNFTPTVVVSNDFEIRAGIVVTAPTAGVKWTIGTGGTGDVVVDNLINWTITGVVANVKLEYSKDGTFASPLVIAASQPSGTKPYDWAIPANLDVLSSGNSGKIRVSDASLAVVYGTSAGFMVKSGVTVTRPNTSDILKVGDAFDIQWTTLSTGADMGNVEIKFSKTGGAPWTTIATVAYNSSPYTLWAPGNGDITSNAKAAKVRIEDTDNAVDVFDDSDAFEIEGKITLNAPNTSNLKWPIGTSQDIKWTPTGTYANVKLHYAKNYAADGFANAVLINTVANSANGVQSTYAWTVPAAAQDDDLRIRVSDDLDANVNDFSDFSLTILPALTLTAPQSGELWYKGDTNKAITWTTGTSVVSNVKIEYKTSAAGSYTTIVADDGGHSTAGVNSYTWALIPDEKTDDAYIKVTDVNHATDVFDVGDAAFSIRPKITVTSPTLDQNVQVGTNNASLIQWTLGGATTVSNVDVHYSVSGGGFTAITGCQDVLASAGACDWNGVPDALSGNVVIRVADSSTPANPNVFGLSPAFDILGKITVDSPGAGVNWKAGDTGRVISWTPSGTMGNLNLYYYHDGAYELLNTVPQTPSSYAWNPIPTQVEENTTIKIVDADTEGQGADEVAGVSAAFNLIGGFAFNPEPPATLGAGAAHTITWDRIAAAEIATAKLEFYNGAAWVNIDFAGTNTGLVNNTGSYGWTVPTSVSCTACKFRISDPDNAGPTLIESAAFEIRPSIAVTAPTAGAEWTIGTGGTGDVVVDNLINWTITGVVANVKLEYSKDGTFASPLVIAASQPSGTKPYDWAIPTNQDVLTTGNAGKIRVSDASLAVVYGTSAGFMVKSGITVTRPNASDVPVVGTAFNIQWTTLSTGADMGDVNLKFSKTGVAPWTTIAAVAYNSSPYTLWAPADTEITAAGAAVAKILIEDADNTTKVFDESDAFAVKGSAALTAPAAGNTWFAGDAHTIVWDRVGNIGPVDFSYSWNNQAYVTIASGVASPSATGNTQSWTLPTTDIVSTNVKVKMDGPTMAAPIISPAFTVKGKLTLTYPDVSGIVLALGDTLNVTWNVAGDIGPVKVEYFDGSAWILITNSAAQGGPQGFTLSGAVTTTATASARVRITDADDPSVTDTSANAFTVRPYLAITSPVSGNTWVVGSSHPITWDRIGGNVTSVKLEYSNDNFTGSTVLFGGSTPNDGTEAWTIPDDIQSVANLKMKISSLPTSDPYAVSTITGGNFQIIGALEMAQPDDTTGVKWRVGSSGNEIKWNATGSIQNVKLEYSTNSGTNWSTVVSSTPSGAGPNKSYPWTIPNNATIAKDTVRFRVLDAANTNVLDASTAASSLLASFGLVHPVTNDVWVAETSNDVEWTTPVPGVPANVKIEYDLNDAQGWQVLSASTANSGTKSWLLGPGLSTSAKVRISDVNDADSTFEGTPFKIRGDLTMTAPNTGLESWEIATSQPVTWTKKGNITAVKLQLSTDGGTNYSALVDGDAANTQNIDVTGAGPYTFNWKVPDLVGITTTLARIRVMDANDANVFDPSNANFTIKGRVTLTTPNGGQTLTVGVPYAVTGSIFGPITSVRMFYSTNGGATYPFAVENCALVPVVAGSYSCNWAVPDQLGTNVKVRVEDAANNLVFDESDAALSIKGSAAITAPVNGNIWFAGDAHTIVWDRTGTIGNVDLSYSVNNGAYTTIAGGVASPSATGNTFSWTLPTSAIVSPNVKVKIDATTLVAPAISAQFTVKGKLFLGYPDAAGISTTLGDTLTVTWTAAGDIGPVKVEYYDGSAWATVTTTAPQNGPYGFTLDGPVTTLATAGAKVRITDADDATVTDESTNAFIVRPLLAVTSPSGGDTWVVGSSHPITWTQKGSNVSNVKIEYSNNNFTSSTVLFGGTTPNDGTQAWTIPDDIQSTPNLKLKISSLPTSDPFAVSATSGGNFQIIGALVMTQPDDTTGVKWRVNTSGNEIKWNATGSVVNVKLDYSLNSGTDWTTITTSTPSGAGNNKSYDWAIPANAAPTKDTVRFRVSDAANTNVLDTADANSSLLANFTFVHPLAGEVWVAQTSRDIEWTTPTGGVPANVKLEYKLTDVAGWQLITSSTTNSGIRSWTLPSGLSQTAKVRISDAGDADSVVESAAFKIRGDLVLTAPNTGLESWEIDTLHDIVWTKQGDLTAVKLQISTDGGTNYGALVDGNAADTQNIDVTGAGPYTFTWKVPDVPGITSTGVRIRVVDATDATVYDSSNASFTIKGRVELTTPNGGETLTVGVPYAVTGSVFGPIPSVKLFYSTNGGSTYDYAVENCATVAVSGGLFSCNWAVPDRLGPNVMVKVEDAGNPLVFDASNAVFAIKGNAAVTAPISGNVWFASNQHQITWDRTGTIGNVDLAYSVNNGAYTTIATDVPSPNPSGNSFDWTLPSDNIVSTNVKVRISGVNLVAPAVSAAFTVKGKLTLTYPDAAGISLTLGDTMNVTWTVAGDVGPIKVEYYNGAAWSTLTSAAPQAGPYALLLDAPNTTVATAGAKVRVSDPDDASVTDESANAFTVRPLLAVTSPAGGETWVVNAFQDVLWNFKGSNIATVRLEYSTDGGSTYTGSIAASTANDGAHSWQIPDAIQAVPNFKVRASTLPTSDPWAVTAVSNGLFKIVGALTLTTPQGADRWGVGTTHDIKWQRTGSIPNIRLTYSTDGTNYNPIVDSYPGGNGDTGFPWTIPNVANIVSNTVTVRISDSADSSVNHVSPQFKIVPSFTITAPALDQRVTVNRPFTVTWNRQGQNPTIDLYYSLDGFSGPGIPIALAETNDGSYDWAVPDQAGLASGFVPANVRVAYPDDATVFDDSDQFRLVSGVTVTAPNSSADKWDVGSSRTIQWTATSANVPQVKIEYSVDGGANYPFVITNGTSNTGAADATRSYVWNPVPDTITDQLRVRVTATNDALAVDTSDSNAKIKAFFQLLTPSASGIVLTVAQPYNITWNWTGSVSNVRLDYSKDDFATAPVNVTPSTLNDGVFEWTLPDDISDTVKIQVRSTTDVDALDRSDNAFKIRGDFLVTAPNGGDQFLIGFPHNITWQTTGNITSVNLVAYSTQVGDPGFPYTAASPYSIAAGLANNPNAGTTYSWNPVPDLASPNVRVRVVSASDATVYDDSDANFKIQGSFTMTSPNGGETFTVGTTRTVTWDRTGSSIATAKLSYSTAGASGPWTTILETEGTANDGIVTNDGSFDWLVPDALASAAWFRVEDPNDATVFDVSNGSFRIGASFLFVTPAGGERWITNEVRTVSWDTTGSVPSVNLLYSKDNFTTSTVVANGLANVTGLNTYGWTIPDDLSASVKLRLVDAGDPAVYADSSTFTIDYYQITFHVRDLLSNAHIDSLTVSAINQSNNAYTWNASGLTSPITRGFPAGSWIATFTQNAYGDQGVSFVADQDQTSPPITVLMETKIVHIYDARTTFAYDALADQAGLSSTLNRDGIVVSGVNFCEIKVYDSTSPTPDTPIKVFTNNGTPDAQGFYNFTWTAPTGLVTGKVYNVRTQINVATTGAVFITPSTFTVTQEKTLKAVKDEVETKLDVPLSQVRQDVQDVLQAGVDQITTTLDDFNTTVQGSITELQDAAAQSLVSAAVLESAAQSSDQAAQTLKNVALTQSAKLLIPQDATTGLPLIIRWRGPSAADAGNITLTPSVKIENADNQAIVAKTAMRAVSGAENLFEYVIDTIAATDYAPGRNVTVTVDEPNIGNLAVGTIFIKRPDGRLLMKTTAKVGETVSIQLAGADNWNPVIELSSDGVVLTPKQLMTKVASDGKVTTFEFKVPESLGNQVPIGKSVVAIVTEPLTGFFDQGAFSFTATSLDDLSGQIAAAATSRSTMSEILTSVKDMEGTLGTDGMIGQRLESLKVKIDRIPKTVAEEGTNVQMREAISEVAERITRLAGEEGFDFSQLITKGLEEAPTIKEIRKATDEVQGATEVMQVIMEKKLGGVDDPVVHVLYE